MKKTLFTTVFFFSILLVRAQDQDRVFKPWKVDLSLGGAIPQGAGSKGGGLIVVEPKLAVSDQFWMGLRLETAIMARSFASSDGSTSTTNISGSGSYLITGDYYFTTTSFRPFIGAGGGLFRLASASIDNNGNGSPVASDTKLGGMLRVGFETGHFRLGVEYNFVGNSTIQSTDANGYPITLTSRNSYLGIKLGVVFGGGRQQ